jgi:DNA-binding transcriptional ArsR family regulator
VLHQEIPMSYELNVSSIAALLADPARATMLAALLDGRALPAGELALASGVTAQTASSHLSKLLVAGLVAVETEGRHRYYRLSGSDVAEAIEHLAAIRPAQPPPPRALGRHARELIFARRCYNHLAGRLGVAVTRGLQRREFIVPAPGKLFDVTPAGIEWFDSIGIDVAALKPTRCGLARQCLDWTERTHHLAGPLGVELMSVLCARGWLRRSSKSRAVQVTPTGYVELQCRIGLDIRSLQTRSVA